MSSQIFRYQENSPLEIPHPENSHPSNSFLENSLPENSHPENFNQISDLFRCIKKNFAACVLFSKYFGYDGNVFHIFIQEMFNFSKIRPHQKEVSKESEKTCEESFCMLKTTFI